MNGSIYNHFAVKKPCHCQNIQDSTRVTAVTIEEGVTTDQVPTVERFKEDTAISLDPVTDINEEVATYTPDPNKTIKDANSLAKVCSAIATICTATNTRATGIVAMSTLCIMFILVTVSMWTIQLKCESVERSFKEIRQALDYFEQNNLICTSCDADLMNTVSSLKLNDTLIQRVKDGKECCLDTSELMGLATGNVST